jgi:hypothetical protein
MDSFLYLGDVFTRLPGLPGKRLDELLPNRWLEEHPEARHPRGVKATAATAPPEGVPGCGTTRVGPEQIPHQSAITSRDSSRDSPDGDDGSLEVRRDWKTFAGSP